MEVVEEVRVELILLHQSLEVLEVEDQVETHRLVQQVHPGQMVVVVAVVVVDKHLPQETVGQVL